MGLYDDLIPAKADSSPGLYDDLIPAKAPAAATGLYDDLIPKAMATDESVIAKIEGLKPWNRPDISTVTGKPTPSLVPPGPQTDAQFRNERRLNLQREMQDVGRDVDMDSVIRAARFGVEKGLTVDIPKQAGSALTVLGNANPQPGSWGNWPNIDHEQNRKDLKELGRGIRKSASERGEKLDALVSGEGQNPISEGAYSVGSSAASMLPTVPAAMIGGLPASAVVSGMQSFLSTLDDAASAYKARNSALTDDQAEAKALVPSVISGLSTALVTAGFGKTGLEAEFQNIPTIKAWIKKAAGAFGMEAAEEGTDQIWQSVIAEVSYRPDMTPEDAAKEISMAALAGGLITVPASGIKGFLNRMPPAAKEVAQKLVEHRQAGGPAQTDQPEPLKPVPMTPEQQAIEDQLSGRNPDRTARIAEILGRDRPGLAKPTPASEFTKPAPEPVKPTADLAAELESAMRGNQVAEKGSESNGKVQEKGQEITPITKPAEEPIPQPVSIDTTPAPQAKPNTPTAEELADIEAELSAMGLGIVKKPTTANAVTPPATQTTTANVTTAESQTDATTTPPAKRIGVTAKSQFSNETEAHGYDLLAWIADTGGMLSKSAAKKARGADWWNQNKSDWDDAPARLAMPYHNNIYNQNATRTPNQIAEEAFRAGKLEDGKASTLWAAIGEASYARKNARTQAAKEKIMLKQLGDERVKFEKSTEPEKGKLAVTSEVLKPGDTLTVDGEHVEVVNVDAENGEVLLRDGKKFGEQTLTDGQKIYVENVEWGPEHDEGTPETPRMSIAAINWELNALKKKPNPTQADVRRITALQAQLGQTDFTLGDQQRSATEVDTESERRKQQAELERRLNKRLVGTSGDLGQGALIGPAEDLFGMSAKPAQPTPEKPKTPPPQSQGSLFSRGNTPGRGNITESDESDALNRLADAPGVQVKVATPADLEGKPDGVEAWATTENGKPVIYIVPDNIQEGTLGAIMGEEVAHTIFSSPETQTLLHDLAGTFLTSDVVASLQKGGYVQMDGESDEAYRTRLMDEHFAKANRENVGDWKRIIERARAWIATTFPKWKGVRLTDQEIGRALLRAVKAERVARATIGHTQDGATVTGPTMHRLSIRAYHGSPHSFDKFSSDKIGTGEGAQVYGYGLYFAENRKVAESYKGKDKTGIVDGKRVEINEYSEVENAEQLAVSALNDADGDYEKATKNLNVELEAARKNYAYLTPFRSLLVDALDIVAQKRAKIVSESTLYKVDIEAEKDNFLNWDKPLKDQPENIKNILHENWLAHKDDHAELYGIDIYRAFQRGKFGRGENELSDIETSKELLKMGIKGIRYLDQGSRTAQHVDGGWMANGKVFKNLVDATAELDAHATYNYVIFDDSIIKIVEKNGQPVDAPRYSLRSMEDAPSQTDTLHEPAWKREEQFAAWVARHGGPEAVYAAARQVDEEIGQRRESGQTRELTNEEDLLLRRARLMQHDEIAANEYSYRDDGFRYGPIRRVFPNWDSGKRVYNVFSEKAKYDPSADSAISVRQADALSRAAHMREKFDAGRFSINPEVANRYREDFLKSLMGALPAHQSLQLGPTSPALKTAGLPDGTMYITQKTLNAKPEQSDHPYPIQKLLKLPEALYDPILVHESWTEPDSFVALTEIKTKEGNLAAALHFRETQSGVEVTEISSVYPRSTEQILKAIENTGRSGGVTYYHKQKVRDWLSQHSGFNSPQYWVQLLGQSKAATDADVLQPKNVTRYSLPKSDIESILAEEEQLATEWSKAKRSGNKQEMDRINKRRAELLNQVGGTTPTAEAQPTPRKRNIPSVTRTRLNLVRDRILKGIAYVRGKWNTLENRNTMATTKNVAENEAQIAGLHAANFILHELNRAFGDKVDTRNKVRNAALTFVIETGGDRAKLAEFRERIADSDHANGDWQRQAFVAIAYAEKYWDKLNSVAETYRETTDMEFGIENDNDVDTLYREGGYVFHVQDVDNSTWGIDDLHAGGGSSAPTAFLKIRDHATYAEALAAGINPQSLDAVDLLQARVSMGQMAVNQRVWVKSLKNVVDPTDHKPVVTDVETRTRADGKEITNAPPGYSKVNFGGQEVAIHNGYKGIFNALTKESAIADSELGKLILKATSTAKHTMLLFDTFHLGRLAFWNAWAQMGLPRFEKGLILLDNTESGLREMINNGDVPKEFEKGLTEAKFQLNLLVHNGLNVGNVSDNLHTDWIKQLPGVGKFNTWLFEKYQRGAMSMIALSELERQRRNHPEMPLDRVARMVAKNVNVRFGNLKANSIWKSRTMQDITRILFLAPQWNEGLIRAELGSFQQLLRAPAESIKQRKLVIGLLGRTVPVALVGTFIMNQFLNLWFRGKPTWENPEEQEGAKISAWIPDKIGKEGSPGFFLNPMGIPMEITHLMLKGHERHNDWGLAVRQFVNGRLSALGRIPWTLATQHDPMDKKIRKGEMIETLAKSSSPLPIAGSAVTRSIKQLATGENEEAFPGQFEKQVLQSFGIKTDQAASPDQRITALAKEFKRKLKPDQQEGDYGRSDYAELSKAIRLGNNRDAKQALDDLLATKNPKDIAQHFKEQFRHPYTTKAYERKFYDELNDEQKQTYQKAIKDRVELSDRFWKLFGDAMQKAAK